MKPLSCEAIFAACTRVNEAVDKEVEDAISEALLQVVKSNGGVEDMESLWRSAYSSDGQAAIQRAKSEFLRNRMVPHMRKVFGALKTGLLLRYVDAELPHNDTEARFNLALAMYKLSQLETPAHFASSMNTEDFKKLIRLVDAASYVADVTSQDEQEEKYRRHEALYGKQKASIAETVVSKVTQSVGGDGSVSDMAKGALKFLKDKISSKKPPRSIDVQPVELIGSTFTAAVLLFVVCIVGSGSLALALFPIQMAVALMGGLKATIADDPDEAGIHSPISKRITPRLFAGVETTRAPESDKEQNFTMFNAKEERRKFSTTKATAEFRNRGGSGGELQGR